MKRTIFALLLTLALCGAQQLRGVNYGIQRPDGSCGSYEQVLADFQVMSTFAQAAKIYNMGFCTGAQFSIIASRAVNMKLFLGMAAGPPDAFQNELNILKQLGAQYGFSNVIGITVGSEDLYRQSVSADTIANYIQQVQAALRALGASVPVTHTDVYYLQPSNILAVEDIVMMNAFSFWEGQSIDNALNTFISHYESLKSQAGGKTVWIGETGWPAAGTTQAGAVASPQNAGTYLREFICWANANGVPYFYFEAFDEPWKGSDPNGAIEVSFGIYNSDRTRKSYFNFQCPGSSSTTSSNPPATTAPVDCKAMFSSLSCTTSSEDPSQLDSSQVSNARGWLCANYPQFCTEINTGGKYASCNSAEQISYAMSQYYNANGATQGSNACSFGGLGHVTGGSASSTTQQAQSTTGAQATTSAQATSSITPTPSSSSSSSSCQNMFSTLSCTTSSEDPSQLDSNSINNARGWLCANYPQFCTEINTGGKYASCNSAEQISYAMSQYYNAYSSTQGSNACSFGGLGHVTGNSGQNQGAAQTTSSQNNAATTSSQNNRVSTTTSGLGATPSTTSSDTCATASYCGVGTCACNGACYLQNQYCCRDGQLTQKAFC